MNITFCYKWKRDPGDAAVTSDGSLKWFFTNLKPSDDESAAIISARQIAEATEGEITAVTIGDGDPTWALARGAKKAISVGEYLPQQDEYLLGSQLANAIQTAGEQDVILMGDNTEYAGAAGVVAAKLGLPLVAGISSLKYDENQPGALVAVRTTEDSQETLLVKLPAVITISAADSEKVRPTMRQMMAAKKLPVEKVDAASLPEVAESKLSFLEAVQPESREAEMIEGDAREAAKKLAGILRENNLI